MARALAPSFGLDEAAADRAAAQVDAALALPLSSARGGRAGRGASWACGSPTASGSSRASSTWCSRRTARLVVVDYKTDAIVEAQALAQAAHHAPQLQLYGRGLAQALGLPVRERLVLFTALGRVVQV